MARGGRPRRDSYGPIPPKVTISITGELEEKLREYMASNQHLSAETAIHELIQVGLASTPRDGAFVAARWQAFYDVKTLLLKRVMAFVTELKSDIESEQKRMGKR